MPRKTYSVPSVTTSAGTRAAAIRPPLIAPQTAPSRVATRSAIGIGMPGAATNRLPVANAARPSTEPTDRSTLRVMITTA